MKRLLLALLLPFAVSAQQDKTNADPSFEGWKISDCQVYALNQLTKGANGELKGAAKGRISENTKTIYIAKQTWLQEIRDTTFNGITIKQVNIDSNLKMLAEEVKNGTAAIYYISPFELKSPMCEMWIFPIDIEKGFMSKAKQEYATTVFRMNFFFNYDPPKYEYRGTDAVVLE
jgi:hypothetical protein